MALAMAILAIVLIGALVASAFFVSNEDFRIGRNSLVALRAFSAAEYGLATASAEWDRARNLKLDVGHDTVVSYTTGDGGEAAVTVTRLNAFSFLLVSQGSYRRGTPLEIVRRTSLVLRMVYPVVKAGGALTLRGGASIGGGTEVSGANVAPPGWRCAGFSGRDTAGVAHGPGSPLSIEGAANVRGKPPAAADPDAGDETSYISFGDESWESLARDADVITGSNAAPMPHSADGRCSASSANWGEPHRDTESVAACESYFPIVFAPGNLRVSGGRGQGILLVDGDLQIDGPFEWNGLIIVKDDVADSGTATITGGVMARNADAADGASAFTGHSTFQYSSCAIESALRGSARMVPVKERAWAEMW